MKNDETNTNMIDTNAELAKPEQIDGRRAMIEALGDRLEMALHLDDVQNEDMALYDQAYALDLVFKKMLHIAEERSDKGPYYLNPALYALALKAQDQFRRTLLRRNRCGQRTTNLRRNEQNEGRLKCQI